MAVSVVLNTPLADELSNVVQPKLAEVGWSTGGSDDSALAEYIILMLVNGKTQDQIATELSNDLLNLGPDDSGAMDFARWLFQQVDTLNQQANGISAPPPQLPESQEPTTQAIPSFPGNEARRGSRQSGGSGAQDADMGDAMEIASDGIVPTGPKSMRNGPRPGNKRMMGQLSKAMDRSADSVLHRVRPQQGVGRVDMHNRQPPKGPRGDTLRAGPMRPGPSAGPAHRLNQNRGPGGPVAQMSTQQQMQMLAFYEQQAKMMSQILTPQQQSAFMPQVPGMAINPAFRNGMGPQGQQQGKSLFERVESNPHRQFGGLNRRPQQNGNGFHPRPQQDSEMADSDISSSMEVENSQNGPSELSPNTVCKFNMKCTKADCIFAHQSPAAPPGITIDVSDECSFAAACQNRKCVARHPSPAQKKSHQSEQDCRFYPNCTNAKCSFRHPTMPVCRNGADCTKEGCKFTHVKTMCKFNPCLNPSCFYKHEDGQKRGAFGDKVWTAEGSQEREHVSERKFIVDNDGVEEELIVPSNTGVGGSQSSLGAEVVT